MIRKIIPANIKLKLKLILRKMEDKKLGYDKRIIKNQSMLIDYENSIKLTQIIRPSHLFENKIANLKIASQLIEQYIIHPNEIFSFWRIVGEPNQKNGYKKGRNIVGGKLQEAYGGGLCQLSGIIYHLALISGLEILERHNHSMDIYTDETRYSPLGADATVVYGYKDLRIVNNFDFPIRLKFQISNEQITALLSSSQEIKRQKISFEKQEKENITEICTFDSTRTLIAQSYYKHS